MFISLKIGVTFSKLSSFYKKCRRFYLCLSEFLTLTFLFETHDSQTFTEFLHSLHKLFQKSNIANKIS